MTAYLYRCVEPASPDHRADAEQFIDAQELSSRPFLTRPAGQRLNAALKQGDRVTLALEEFPQSTEAFRVLGEWDGRGVGIFLLHQEPGCETIKGIFDKAMGIFQGFKKAQAEEDAAYKAMCN